MQQELSSVIYQWLRATGNRVSRSFCEQEITSHLDYPAISSAADFLDTGGMEYEAVRAGAENIHEFNYPALAHIKEQGNEYFRIVKNPQAWADDPELKQRWSGITIFPGEKKSWNNADNANAIRSQQKQTILFISWCLAGAAFYGFSVWYSPGIFFNVFGILSLAGIFISAAAFSMDAGIQNKAIKQVCGIVSAGGCEKVMKSKWAKGFFGITPADASLMYFTSQFGLYLAAVFFPPVFSFLPALSLASLAIAALSIYSQAIIIRQWCSLCLSIAAVLTAQAATGYFLLAPVSILSMISFGILFLFCLGILLPVKGLIKSMITARQPIAALKKWKSDPAVFMALSEKMPLADITQRPGDIIIGSRKAPVTITIACNPYCAPCAAAHHYLDELVEGSQGMVKVQVKWLFNIANKADTKRKAVSGILQAAKKIKDPAVLQEMLSDWFTLMNYEKWEAKWHPDENTDTSHELALHDEWVRENAIRFTPTFFVNGRLLPDRYNYRDIEKFIPELGMYNYEPEISAEETAFVSEQH